MIFSAVYLLVRRLLGCLMVLTRREVSKDAELLVLRHQNAVLRRQIGRVRYQRADQLWLAALSRVIPRPRWGEVFAVTPDGARAALAAAAPLLRTGQPEFLPEHIEQGDVISTADGDELVVDLQGVLAPCGPLSTAAVARRRPARAADPRG